jgi:hypothetical protein
LWFRVEPLPGHPVPDDRSGVYVEVFGSSSEAPAPRRLLAKASASRGAAIAVPLDNITLPLPLDLAKVSIVFHDIAATEMIRVMELKLMADDFAPTAADLLCR